MSLTMQALRAIICFLFAALACGFPIDVVDNRTIIVNDTMSKRMPIRDPALDDDTWIILVNATPYRWKKGYIHEYQMKKWMDDWPEYIWPGQAAAVWVHPSSGWYDWADSAAEVEYHLQGSISKPTSLMVKFKNRYPSSTKVEFRGELSSLNNAPHSEHDLGFEKIPGGSGFILAGKEGHFITNDPPISWMQALLPHLGEFPLREIILPRSHHAGLWKNVKRVGFGIPENTQTQTISLPDQLGNGGIRVIDLRPVRDDDEFRESHGTKIANLYHGMLGASLGEMIDFVNDFNKEYPGELIIWDVHATDALNGNDNYRPLDREDRELLYSQFQKLEHRVNISSLETDVTKWTLNKLIGNKTSAVIINFDESWRQFDDGETFLGGKEGFVTSREFPLTHHWSNSDDPNWMAKDQIRHFRQARPSRDNPIHVSDWLLTQQGVGVVFPVESITELARGAWQTLFTDLWRASTSESYPNWVAVDNVHGNQHKSLVMAMNYCLVAKQCGGLGDKVKGYKPIGEKRETMLEGFGEELNGTVV